MSLTADATRSFGGWVMVERLRSDPRVEDWWVEDTRDRRLILRRAQPHTNDEKMQQAIIAIVDAAQRLHHPHLIRVESYTREGAELACLIEPIISLRAADLINYAQTSGRVLPAKLAVWIAREAARTLSELALDPASRRGITPPDLHLGVDGVVRAGAYELLIMPLLFPGPKLGEIEAIGGLLDALLRAGSKEGVAIQTSRSEVPAALWAIVDRCQTGGFRDLRSLESALSRFFYAELNGDDLRDGQEALVEWVRAAQLVSAPIDIEVVAPPTDPPIGVFTKALEERAAPVMPQPLSSEDYDVSERSRGIAPPSPVPLEIPELPQASKDLLKPSRSLVSSFSSEGLKSARGVPFAALWFSMGFIIALFVVAVIQVFFVGCATAVRRAGDAQDASYYRGTTTMTSTDGVTLFAPPSEVLLERRVDEDRIVELRTARAQTERIELTRIGDSSRFEAKSDMGPSGSVTFESETRWRYDLTMTDGSGKIEGTGQLDDRSLTTEKWFLTPDGSKRAKIVDQLQRIDAAEYRKAISGAVRDLPPAE